MYTLVSTISWIVFLVILVFAAGLTVLWYIKNFPNSSFACRIAALTPLANSALKKAASQSQDLAENLRNHIMAILKPDQEEIAAQLGGVSPGNAAISLNNGGKIITLLVDGVIRWAQLIQKDERQKNSPWVEEGSRLIWIKLGTQWLVQSAKGTWILIDNLKIIESDSQAREYLDQVKNFVNTKEGNITIKGKNFQFFDIARWQVASNQKCEWAQGTGTQFAFAFAQNGNDVCIYIDEQGGQGALLATGTYIDLTDVQSVLLDARDQQSPVALILFDPNALADLISSAKDIPQLLNQLLDRLESITQGRAYLVHLYQMRADYARATVTGGAQNNIDEINELINQYEAHLAETVNRLLKFMATIDEIGLTRSLTDVKNRLYEVVRDDQSGADDALRLAQHAGDKATVKLEVADINVGGDK